jgi:hypothetical protein
MFCQSKVVLRRKKGKKFWTKLFGTGISVGRNPVHRIFGAEKSCKKMLALMPRDE